MTTQQIAAALEAWIVELIPALDGSSYTYHASQKSHPFPDVAIEIDEMRTGDSPGDVGMPDGISAPQGWEQVCFRSWTVRMVLMVDEDPPVDAENLLREYSDLAHNAVLLDRTLGQRISWVSHLVRSDFTPPFVSFSDGARGRAVTIEMLVGDVEEFEE